MPLQVTGGGRGLGRELAFVLAEKKCQVIVVDLNLAEAEQTAKDVTEKTGMFSKAYECDVSNWDAVNRLHEEIVKDVGVVDILINNAGLILFQSFMDNAQADIEKLIDVNVNGVIWVSAFLKIFS
jgi:NAD(P)-dependent dehydrogenase (short-subunit alcohol dehydrogenase family)